MPLTRLAPKTRPTVADQFPDATKMVLSPAAQAVLDAYGHCQGTYEAQVAAACSGTARLAAALRAAADQVVPDEPDYMRAAVPSTDWWDKHDSIRSELLAIANELGADR